MRDIIVSLVILGLMPTCFRRPFVGLAMFSWLAYMRVQDLTWGFARGMRWSYYIAMVTGAGFIVSKERKRWFLPDPRSYIMLTMVVLIGIGVLLSDHKTVWQAKYQVTRYLEYIKIVVIALFTTAVVTNRERLRVLVWIIALSFGFYGIKSGTWGILTLGQTQILQGPGGMLADNNDFSLALSMAVPMLFFLGWTERRPEIRKAFFFCLPMTLFTILLTRSRGGFLSVGSAVGLLIWRSKNRMAGIMVAMIALIAGMIVMPEEYRERLLTMTRPTEESSAASRIRAWGIATRMAMDHPVLGVGFGKFPQYFLDYCNDPTGAELSGREIIVAHSSYFQIWAECGTIAITIYLTMIFMCFVTCWKVRAKARRLYHSSWIINYASMFEASLLAFVVGSAFLNRAHFDLLYHWVALIMVFGRIAQEEMTNPDLYPVRTGARGEIHNVRKPGFHPRPKRDGFRRKALPGGV